MKEEIKAKAKRIHCPGLYCETAMIRDVLEMNGLRLSGSECLGLAGIVGFAFIKPNSHLFNLPHNSVTGIPYNAMVPLMNNLNLRFEKFENQSFEQAIEDIKYFLGKDIPVIIRVAYNQYYGKVFGETDNKSGHQGAESIFSVFKNYLPYNTGTHFIMAIDYNEEKDTIEFVENMFRGSFEMDMPTLKAAMDSKQKMCAVNEWTVVYPFEEFQLNSRHVGNSIRRIVNGMEQGIEYYGEAQSGLQAMESFIEDFFTWKQKFPEQVQLENMALLFLSGGGIYRREGFYRNTFCKYLIGAERLTGQSQLGKASAIYKEAAAKWDTFLSIIKNGLVESVESVYADDTRRLLDEIYELEKKGIAQLKIARKGMW